MTKVARCVARRVARRVASSMDGELGGWEFDKFLTFANASERIIIHPTTGVVRLFAAGTPAIINVGGRRYLSSENSRQCLDTQNQALDNVAWTKYVAGDSLVPVADPLGGSTAYNYIPSTDNARHFIYESKTCRTAALIAKANGYGYAYIRVANGGGTNINVYICDLSTGVITELVLNGVSILTFSRSQSLAWGGYYFEVTVSENTGYVAYGVCNSTATTQFAGDGVKGAILWLPQANTSTEYCGSSIRTVASAVTRAADNGYIAAASVPIALKDKIIARARFNFAGTQTTGVHTLFEFVDTTQNIRCYYDGADKKVKVGGTLKQLGTGCIKTTSDNTNAYYTDYAGGNVVKVNKTTGVVTTLATGRGGPFGIRVDATDVYFAERSTGKISKVPIAGGSVTELATGLTYPLQLTLSNDTVFWVDGTTKKLQKVAKAGGSVVDLTTFTDPPYGIDNDGTYLYVSCSSGTTDGLTRILFDGSGQEVIDVAGVSYNLHYYSGYVYYFHESTAKLFKINTTTLATTELVSSGAGYHGVRCDGTNVYFTDSVGSSVSYVSINGGTVIPVVTGCTSARGLTVDTYKAYICDYSAAKFYSIFKAPIVSAATTHSALQEISAALDRVAGTITLAGFTTGTGATTGTAWDRTDGALYVGRAVADGENADGFVSLS